MPRSLDLARLKQFERPAADPQPQSPPEPHMARAPEPVRMAPEPGRWPSREPMRDGQISIKAPTDVIDRFRRLCKDDRRTYSDMLAILMNAYEQKG